MSNLVIVAIPAEDDYVWKISSEKVPHLTLLFLGDEEAVTPEQARRITEFMDHVVTTVNMGPFYLDVDYRGTLGDDKADVLYFDKGWDSKEIERVRGQLLQQSDIKTLYDVAPQFPEWLPHLTLGYPDSPAKKPDDDHTGQIHHVRFDRLAIWFDDYDGPEFRLKREYVESESYPALAWGDDDPDFLEHYGVKGMKWGHRREGTRGGYTRGDHAKNAGMTKRERNAQNMVDVAKKGKAAVDRLRSSKKDMSTTKGVIADRRARIEQERRAKRAPVDTKATDTIGPTKFNKTKIRTKGGEDHPATDDAIKVALVEQKLKKSGPAALTNQELKTMNERLQLEQNTARLVSERKTNGKGFVRRAISKHGKNSVDRGTQKVFNSATDKALEEASRRAKNSNNRG